MVMKEDNSDFGTRMKFNSGSKSAVATVIKGIRKDYGEDSIVLGDTKRGVDALPTGSFGLDIATGIGGYPRGRLTVLAGWEASGKTTHALKAITSIQRMGGKAVFIDTEYALDPLWAEKQGVDMGTLEWIQTEDLETAGEVAVRLAASHTIDLLVFDSIAGAPIKAVVAGELGDSNMGKRAKIMSDFIPKLNGPISRNNMWMIFTNQQRDSLNPYAPKPVRPGGHAANYHASMIIILKAKKKTGSPVEIIAHVEKNKISVPFKEAKYFMDDDGAIDEVDELATILTDKTLIDKLGIIREGMMYTLPKGWLPNQENRFKGKPAILELLGQDLDLLDKIKQEILSIK